jgi:NAD dependent epimerase/dehydratase family enzyme
MRRPAFFRTPSFLLRLMLGEKAILVLEGQRPVPRRLLKTGFAFRFPTLEMALADLLKP